MKTPVLKVNQFKPGPLLNPWWLRLIVMLLFITYLSSAAIGQNKLWDKAYGGSGPDELSTMVATMDGGYLLGGNSLSGKSVDKSEPAKGYYDYWIVKVNADGSKAWDKAFGGSVEDRLQSMWQTLDGGYILGGSSDSGKNGDKSEASKGGYDYWIVKLNATGQKEWDKTLGGSEGDFLTSLQQTSDGGYILGGSSRSNKSGDKSNASKGDSDYWAIKLNAAGQKEWDKTLGGSEGDFLTSLQQTSDGGYILGGFSYSGKGGDKSQVNKGQGDYWVVKLNANGTKQWDKTIGGDQDDISASLQQTLDGGYILGGYSQSGISGDKTEASKGYYDYWIVKLKEDGTKVWDKTLGGNGGNRSEGDDILRSLLQTPDGGYILGGYSNSAISGDKTEDFKDSYDYWVVKLQADGSKQWDKTLGGRAHDYLASVQKTLDGGYILGGSSFSWKSEDKSEDLKGEGDYSNNDYWLVKINETGKKGQTITFDPILYKALNDAPFSISASATSGLPVHFSIVSGPATVKDNIVTLTGVGTVIVKALQPGDTDYQPAKEVFRTFLVESSPGVSKLWDKSFGSSGYDVLRIIVPTLDGGYLLGGSSDSGIGGDKSEVSRGINDYWVVKIDANYTKVWDKTFGGNGYEFLTAIVATPDGGYLLGGQSLSGISGDRSEPNRGDTSSDYWIVKIDANGIKAWDKAFGGNGEDILSTMIPTEGGYLLGGYSSSDKNGDKSEVNRIANDYWVVKTDALGNKLWDKTIGGDFQDILSDIVVMADGGYLLGGSSSSGKSGDKTEASKGGDDYWVVKLNADGAKAWDITLGGNESDLLSSLVPTIDGGYLLGGTSRSVKGGDKSETNHGHNDFWLVKIDAHGTKVWDKVWGGSDDDGLATIVATPNGGYLLGGYSWSGISGDKSQVNRWYSDYWVVKIDNSGNKAWDKTLGGDDYDYLTGLVATPDGSYLLGGRSSSGRGFDKSEASKGGDDYWVVKLEDPDARLTTVVDITSDKDNTINATSPEQNSGASGLLYIGKTGESGENTLHRTLLHFDLSSIPKGSQIDSASLKLFVWRAGPANTGLALHPVTTNWGEKASTWNHAFAPGSSWKTAGGDFAPTASATTSPPLNWEDSLFIPNLAADVQAWVNNPDTNFGWLLKAPVEVPRSAVRLSSREYFEKAYRPALRIYYKAPRPNSDTWNLRYGGSGIDRFTVVIRTADGGYLSGGYSNSEISGDKSQDSRGGADYWIVKTNVNGVKQWDKRYGGSNHDYLNRIIPTQDGGYLLAGSSTSGKGGDKSEGRRGNQDYWIVKISIDGTKQWDKTYGGSGYEDLRKVNQLYNGDYLLAGTSDSEVSGEKSQSSQGGKDYWLVRVSSTGTKLWDKTYGGSGEENLESFTKTSNGGFLLAGSSTSGMSGNKSQVSRGGKDYWLVKINSQGSVLWDKSYGGDKDDELYSIGITSTGEYFVAGHSSSSQSSDKSQASRGASDYWLLKLSSTGEKLWDQSFGGSGRETLRSIIQMRDGGYVLAGSSDSPVSGDKTQRSQGGMDYWIIKTDAEGNKEYDQRFGGSGEEEFRYIQRTADGGLLLGGRSESGVSGDRTQPSQGQMDYWLVKLMPPTTTATRQVVAEVNIASTPATTPRLQLTAYPNPTAGQAVTVSFSVPETQPVSLQLYDSQGKAVTTLYQGQVQAHQQYQVKWQPRVGQAIGLYVLRLVTPHTTGQQKIMLQR